MNTGGLLVPPTLQMGDTVALVAPASPVSPERWRGALRALQRLGYQVHQGEQRCAAPSGYAAGASRARAEELNRLFADPKIRAIWCVRGGYTAASLLPLLDYTCIAQNPKVFVGYSDITCLHVVLNQRCGFVTYHGPMAASDLAEQPSEETLASLRAALAGARRFSNPGGRELYSLRPGQARGQLAGGNLTLIATRLATPWALQPDGKILFLEEVGEPVPVLERLLRQLADAAVFERAAGVLLGSFSDCKNRFWPEYGPMELCEDFFRGYTKPVLAGLQCGHCCPNGTLPFGRICRLNSDAGTICFE